MLRDPPAVPERLRLLQLIDPHGGADCCQRRRSGFDSSDSNKAEFAMQAILKTAGSLVLIAALGAAGGVLAARGYVGAQPDYIEGDYSAQRAHAGEPVIVLGTQWCGYCEETRDHLRARGVAFADLDIEHADLALRWHNELRAEGVPVVLIGDRQIRGFEPDTMDAALEVLAR
jgi:mycoredoxin